MKMLRKIKIAKTASVKNTKLESDDVTVEDKVKLVNVIIKAKKVVIKSGASLTDCKLFSDNTITIGEGTIVKENVIINAFKSISLGNRTIIDRDVTIGGMQSEKSEIVVGNDCVILYRSYLNVTRRILIGNNVGVGGYCLIFTHSTWQNVLEGNHYKFADVIIKDNTWLPWNVTVLPGVTIGSNVTVGSGSVLTKSLPDSVFAAGVPAKIIKRKKTGKFPKSYKNKLMLNILTDFNSYLKNFLKKKSVISKNKNSCMITYQKQKLVYTTDFAEIKKSDIIIAFTVPGKFRRSYEWIEMDSLKSRATKEIARDFVTFVRRYGIKINTI